MNVRMLLAGLTMLACVGWIGAPAFTEEPADPQPPAGAQDPMHEAWIAMGTPGKHHERIAFLAGDWTATMTYWEPGSTEGQTGTGTCTNAWILGGRYMRCLWKSEWQGMAFEGEGTVGYNNVTKEYESTWIDSMSTGQMRETGTLDGQIITTRGQQHTPMGVIEARSEWHLIGDDEYKMASWWTMPGMGEFKVMEIHYKRAE